MQEARREAGRQLRRRRDEETAWTKALDRAATAVAAIVVGDSGGREEEETREWEGRVGDSEGLGFYSNPYALSFGPSLESIPAQSPKSYRRNKRNC